MYEPPKLNKRLKMANAIIEARLKIAKTAPPKEIQFLIDEGNFILLILKHDCQTGELQVCKY